MRVFDVTNDTPIEGATVQLYEYANTVKTEWDKNRYTCEDLNNDLIDEELVTDHEGKVTLDFAVGAKK